MTCGTWASTTVTIPSGQVSSIPGVPASPPTVYRMPTKEILSWQQVPGATYYEVQRIGWYGGSTSIKIPATAHGMWMIYPPYRIRACGPVGCSDWYVLSQDMIDSLSRTAPSLAGDLRPQVFSGGVGIPSIRYIQQMNQQLDSGMHVDPSKLVGALQTMMQYLGLWSGPIDGMPTDKFYNALKNYDDANHLMVTAPFNVLEDELVPDLISQMPADLLESIIKATS